MSPTTVGEPRFTPAPPYPACLRFSKRTGGRILKEEPKTRVLLVEPAEHFLRVDNLAPVELIRAFLNERPHTLELRLSVGFLVLEEPESCPHDFTRGLVAT